MSSTAKDDVIEVIVTSDSYRDPIEKIDVHLGPVDDGQPGMSLLESPVTSKPPPIRKSVSIESSRLQPSYQQAQQLQVLRIREKHGPFYKSIPILPLPVAIVCLIFNVLVPGIGTLTAAFSLICCGRTNEKKKPVAFLYNMLAGILQLVCALVIVGWIWSIMWGMMFIQFSQSKPSEVAVNVQSFYVRKQSSVECEHPLV